MDYSREDLIQICRDAIVPCSAWFNRDSYSAQVNVSNIFSALTSGAIYKYYIENDETIWIDFVELATGKQIKNIEYLNIDSVDDYHSYQKEQNSDYDYDHEMFDAYPSYITHELVSGYLPTRENLNKTEGEDWY